MKSRTQRRPTEKMSDTGFKMMTMTFKIIDLLFPYINRRIKRFNIKGGMTVVDYGCGPGRYTIRFAKEVGPEGKVYATDIHELAIEKVKEKIMRHNLKNVAIMLVKGNDTGNYESGIPDEVADVVCAIDMFFIIKKPKEFLSEIRRILKKDGILIIDDGHQSRKETKKKISESGMWKITEETRDHLKCKLLPD